MKRKNPSLWSYLVVRVLCLLTLIYALSFITDLLLPLKTSDEVLVSREHQKHKWHYWVTDNFRSPVSEEMYTVFPVGERVKVRGTQFYRVVFVISYTDLDKRVLRWERTKLYYFILLLPLFITCGSFVALSNRWDRQIGLNAGISAIIFSAVLIFVSRF